MTRELGTLRSPQVADDAVLVIPLGATEQHGPHLPLNTDTAIATELCRRLAAAMPGVIVAPAIPYGSSGEHADFPGTLSIGQRALELFLLELVRSADHFAAVVLVNGHGGNLPPLRTAVTRLRAEGRNVHAWSPTGPTDDSHAGHTETSVMLAIHPDTVSLHHAEPGNAAPLAQIIDRLRTDGVKAVSPNGVLGNPTTANPADGERILRRWTNGLVNDVRRFLAGHPQGRVPEPVDADTADGAGEPQVDEHHVVAARPVENLAGQIGR